MAEVIIIILLVVVVFRNTKATKHRRVRRIPSQFDQVTYSKKAQQMRDKRYKEMLKLDEKRRKKDLARADIDRCMAQKETILRQLDLIEKELSQNPTPKREEALLGKQISTEAKIYNIDRKMDKLYFILDS